MAERLAPMVGLSGEGAQEALSAWEHKMREEVAGLAKVPCGPQMLYVIGWVYSNRARQFFVGSALRRVVAKVEGKVHLAHSKAKLAGSAGRTYYTVNGVMKSEEKKKKKAEALAAEKAKAQGEEVDHGDGAEAPAAGSAHASGAAEASQAEPAPRQDNPNDSAEDEHIADDAAESDPLLKDVGESGNKPAPEADALPGDDERASVPEAPFTSGSVQGAGAPTSDEDNEVKDFLLGSLVMVQGLQRSPELNDEIGIVCGFDSESGRHLVQILPSGGLKSLKRDNLILLEEPPERLFGSDAGTGGQGTGPATSQDSDSGHDSENPHQDGEWRTGDEDISDAFKGCMPLFHDTLWRATALDIEFTLSKVMQKVLRDMSVPKSARKERAEALLKLGRMLQEPLLRQGSSASVPARPALGTTESGEASVAKRSVLSRLRPRAPWRRNAEKTALKAKEADEKRRRIECAMAMMAAGASTEDVDDMVAAREAMEAEGFSL